jgi:KUP system potassium uptake protein
VLVHHVRHNKVAHEIVILLTVRFEHVPRVEPGSEFEVRELGRGFHRVVVHSGFMQTPDVPALLRVIAGKTGLPIDFGETTYYLGRESFLATDAGKMGSVTESIFAFMSRNAGSATAYFGLPSDRVVELGMQVDL